MMVSLQLPRKLISVGWGTAALAAGSLKLRLEQVRSQTCSACWPSSVLRCAGALLSSSPIVEPLAADDPRLS